MFASCVTINKSILVSESDRLEIIFPESDRLAHYK